MKRKGQCRLRQIFAFVLAASLLLGFSPANTVGQENPGIFSLPGGSGVITLPGTIQNVEAAALAKPALVSAVAKSPTSVQVTWKKVSKASGYYIYRKLPSDKKWKTVKTITKGTAVTYTDTKLTPGKQYMYTVRAYQTVNGKKNAGSYNTKGIAAVTPPEAVKLLKASGKSGAITITWQKAKGAQGYMVYRKSGTSWSRIKTISSAKTLSYTDKTAKAVPGVSYMVRAYCKYNGKNTLGGYQKAGISVPVSSKELKTKPLMDMKYSIVLRWEKLEAATEYQIWKGSSPSALKLYMTKKSNEMWASNDYYRINDNQFTDGQAVYYQVTALTKNGKLSSKILSVVPGSSVQELTPERMAALAWIVIDKVTFGIDSTGVAVEVNAIDVGQDGELHFCYQKNGEIWYVKAGILNPDPEGPPTCWHPSIRNLERGVSVYFETMGRTAPTETMVKSLDMEQVTRLKNSFLKEDRYDVNGGV
ncbi:MAG: fibronectin type III domain-containing protein [Eubacteriales bacterium]|nr:fibronectin type III domain-containing protein [Eubacteriales bacterium]